jgi:opacity protein-like surface antigen
MSFKPIVARVLAAACICGVAAPALAENPLGFYLGGAVGDSDLRSNTGPFGYPGYLQHDTAWKVMAGIRPISLLGAEIAYMDFGHPSDFTYYGNQDTRATATALLGVGYLPLPMPFLDVYGKLGLARLQYRAGSSFACAFAQNSCQSVGYLQDQTDTRFAYGAGVQAKFSSLAVRAEYERISYGSYQDPDMYTIGVTWTF